MVTFQISRNWELIRSVLAEPRCYRKMVNDEAPSIEDFAVTPSDNFIYVLAVESDTIVLALFLLLPCEMLDGTIAAECHFCFIPEAWGHTKEIAEGFLEWVWRETSIVRLLGPVPAYNRLAYRLASAVGFQRAATVSDTRMKNGRSFDVLMMEIQKPYAQKSAA